MCQEFEITNIVNGVTNFERITKECDLKPATGNIKDCPNYKFHAAGSSRRKGTLPEWASKSK